VRRQSRGAASALSAAGAAVSTLALLLDCATAHRRDEARTRLHRRLAGRIDWEAVVESARRHGVAPIVYQALHAAPDGLVPLDVLAGLRRSHLENARRCLLLTGWLRRVVDALATAGVRAIPYKGPVLAALAYGTIASRQAGDLDLLVDPGELGTAKRVLQGEGFRPQTPLEGWQERQLVRSAHPYAFVRDREGIVLELHWSVSPRSLSAGLGGTLPQERLEEVAAAGTRFLTLPADVLLIALCVHGAKHVWERLAWIVDVAELIARRPDLDWAGTLARADAAGHLRELLLGCLLARDLLGTDLPETVSRRIAADAKLPALGRAVSRQLDRAAHGPLGIAETARFHLGIRRAWGDRLAYLRFAMMPTVADWTAVSLPRWLGLLHYPLRAVRLLRGRTAHHH
jgi:hypothetical protein